VTVYVDALREYPREAIAPAARRFGNRWCHLVTDGNLEELHEFATRLGQRRTWFQTEGCPHYDLVPSKRALAVQLGAVEVDHRRFFEIIEPHIARRVAR
jgi:hypothetical protein